MHNSVKLLTGLAATVVLARGGMVVEGYTIIGRLGWAAQRALAVHEVDDGSISFRAPRGHPARIAYLSGTADRETRAAILARLRHHPLIIDARWEER